jgi:DeoR family myo-inositol catabolism operon transcriptional repressor
MEDYIAQKGFVSTEDLCQEFSISANTARADVRELVRIGRAEKMYGGVGKIQSVTYDSYEAREQENQEAKRQIAAAAAQLINDGDVIFLDLGTTCLPIVDFLPENIGLTILTNSLSIITRVSHRKNTTIMTFGGRYIEKSNSFKCTFSALHSYINTCNISKAFLGATGISSSGALTTAEDFGRELRSALIAACPCRYLLADSSKFGKTALMTYGTLADMTVCITDSELPKSYQGLCRQAGTELIFGDRPRRLL